jgi:chromosome segregation ATPase
MIENPMTLYREQKQLLDKTLDETMESIKMAEDMVKIAKEEVIKSQIEIKTLNAMLNKQTKELDEAKQVIGTLTKYIEKLQSKSNSRCCSL